jgi:hypothetical protein
MNEYNLCPKCGSVKSLKQPEQSRRVSTGVFQPCTCAPVQVPGRAYSPEQKRAVIERLYAAWLKVPTLRLGQFIHGATHGRDIFSVEDEALIAELEQWVKAQER